MDDSIARDAQAEQAAAGVRSLGHQQAAYYRGLTEGGVPSDVAASVLRDYCWLAWHRAMYPEHPPEVVPGVL